jgi:hypothetical protein
VADSKERLRRRTSAVAFRVEASAVSGRRRLRLFKAVVVSAVEVSEAEAAVGQRWQRTLTFL